MDVVLRPLAGEDEEPLFGMMRDPEAVRMAAFTAADPSDRAAFARSRCCSRPSRSGP